MQAVYGVGEYRAGEGAFTCWARAGTGTRTSRRAVLGIHGASGTAAGELATPSHDPPYQMLAECGYPLHIGDYCSSTYKDSGGGGWNFGNSDHVAAIAAGVTWMGSYAKTDKVILVAGSMGTIGALNYYKANPTKVLAMSLAVPACDLADITTNDKGLGAGIANNSFVDASMYGLSLPQATINLSETVATSGLSAAGVPGIGTGTGANKVNILTSNGWQTVTFTGISGSQLTGCSGGTGTMSSTSLVSQGYGATIVNAYGHAWPTPLSGADLAASSPVSWTAQPGALTVPTMLWSSDNDPVACNTAACQTWAAAVAAAGGGNVTPTVHSLGAVGHLAGPTPAQQVAWLDSVGGRL